jgi:hypothetical protein
MLTAFESVGVRAFDVTFTDLVGEKTGFQGNRSVNYLRAAMPDALRAAAAREQNYIIRPRSGGQQIIQLDDLDHAKVDRVTPHAFMVLETSPGNYQSWVAVKDVPEDQFAAKDFARRLRKGAGADPSASGATRIGGSLNFKSKYAPDFPLVELRHVQTGRVVTAAELTAAGLVSFPEPKPPVGAKSSAPFGKRSRWPSYQFCVSHAPIAHGKDKPDISRADFTWCRTAIEWGWSVEATAARLMELSAKAKENGQRYATLTARNASESVDRHPYRPIPLPRAPDRGSMRQKQSGHINPPSPT